MTCTRCGRVSQHGDIFCAECGNPLVSPPLAPPEPTWDDPFDETVVVQRKPKFAPWYLVLDSGRHIQVDARSLVGRGASPDPRWPDAVLVHVTDPTKTMSKTHTLVEADGDIIWFTDLDSTNGMSIARGGTEPRQLVSGVRESASAGDAVHLGQFVIRIEREPVL